MVASPTALSRLPDGGRFVALDSWRGLAALGVAAYHINGGGTVFGGRPVTNFNLFVDFFFVLSGFVLAGAYGERLAGGFPIGRFMLLRLGRIYPLHLLMVAAYLALEIAYALFDPAGWEIRAPFSGDRTPFQLVTSLLLVAPWFSVKAGAYNVQSWSIAVELWLYLALALALRFGGRLGAWVLPALAVAGLVAQAFDAVPPFLPPVMVRGVVGFGMGVAVWRLRPALPAMTPRVSGFIELGVVAAMLALFTLGDDGPRFMSALVLSFAAVVLAFAGDRGFLSRLLHRPPFVWLGVLSYSIYMVHGMVLGRLADVLRFAGLADLVMFGGDARSTLTAEPWLATVLAIAMLAACIPVAWLTWRFVEDPARQWSRRRAARWGAGDAESAAPTI